MDRVARFETIKGRYEPRKVDLHLSLEHDGMPDLVLIAEPVKVYNDTYNGIVFYKRANNIGGSFADFSRYGGSTISKHSYTRSPGL